MARKRIRKPNTPINNKFENSEFHHLHLNGDHSIGIYIPKNMHNKYHSRNGIGLAKMNKKALLWLTEQSIIGGEKFNFDENGDEARNSITSGMVERKQKPSIIFKNIPTVRRIKVTFEDDEFEILKKKKQESGIRTWHDFTLWSAGLLKKRDINK